jgi:hypothetical protein
VAGALLIPFGPADEIHRSLNYYSIDAKLAMRVTAVNCTGFGLALIAGSIVGRQYVGKLSRMAVSFGKSMPKFKVILLFFLVGGVSDLYVTLADLDASSEIVSGSIRTASKLLLVAVMVGAAYRGKHARVFILLSTLITLEQVAVGLLLMNKSIVLQSVAALIAGLVWRFNSIKVFAAGIASILLVYVAIAGPVDQARLYVLSDGRASLSERFDFLVDVMQPDRQVDEIQKYGYWTRFSYLVPQGAAIDFYDRGQGGNDYTLLGWAFLPRAFFPQKPVITASGQEFHFKITGGMTSSTGQGVFINGYYNAGWIGAISVGIIVGVILAWSSTLATEIFKSQALIWTPFALLGGFMAFRIDGHFLADYWGSFAILIYSLFLGLGLRKMNVRLSSARWLG